MLNQYHIAENLRYYELPVDLQDLVNTAISGIMVLATRTAIRIRLGAPEGHINVQTEKQKGSECLNEEVLNV